MNSYQTEEKNNLDQVRRLWHSWRCFRSHLVATWKVALAEPRSCGNVIPRWPGHRDGGGREHSFPALFRAGLGQLAGKFPLEKQGHAHPKKDREHSELRNTDVVVCIQKKMEITALSIILMQNLEHHHPQPG